jgi:recombinational DNA repair protein RecT
MENQVSKNVVSQFTTTIEKYEKKNLAELLEGSNMTPAQFKQIVINELKRSPKLQEAFVKNPASLFASILHCAEMGLNPSQMVGEFFFIPYRDANAYFGIQRSINASNEVK